MKGLIIFLLSVVFNCICGDVAMALEPNIFQQKFVRSATLEGNLFLHRSRRQISEEDTPDKCVAIEQRARCTSSFAQSYVSILSDCGDRARVTINQTEQACRINPEGKFCGEAVSQSLTLAVLRACSSLGCDDDCRQALRRVVSQTGCCASTFSDHLKACGMTTPSPCSKSRIVVPPITHDVDSCRDRQDYLNNMFRVYCYYRRTIVNALNRDSRCRNYAREYSSICTSRNGRYCLLELDAYRDADTMPTSQESIRKASTDCPSASNCSSQCRSSLSSLKDDIGCCIRAVNVTQRLFVRSDSAILDPDLWSECNITIPGTCTAVRSKAESLARDSPVFFAMFFILAEVFLSRF